jgi:hypothetical protein
MLQAVQLTLPASFLYPSHSTADQEHPPASGEISLKNSQENFHSSLCYENLDRLQVTMYKVLAHHIMLPIKTIKITSREELIGKCTELPPLHSLL